VIKWASGLGRARLGWVRSRGDGAARGDPVGDREGRGSPGRVEGFYYCRDVLRLSQDICQAEKLASRSAEALLAAPWLKPEVPPVRGCCLSSSPQAEAFSCRGFHAALPMV